MHDDKKKATRTPHVFSPRKPQGLRRQTSTAVSRIREQADSHPLRTLGVALGAGFVIGGGLFSPLTARLAGLAFRVGLRLAVVPLLTQGLSAVAPSFGVSEPHTESS